MLRNLLSRCRDVPEETVETAVGMTGGNPAFLEQLVRLFIENGAIDTSQPAWRLDPDLAADTELPVTIEEAIEARIAKVQKLIKNDTEAVKTLAVCEDNQVDDNAVEKPRWIEIDGLENQHFHNHGQLILEALRSL